MKVKRVVADIHIVCPLDVDACNPDLKDAVEEAVREELFYTEQMDSYVALRIDNIEEV